MSRSRYTLRELETRVETAVVDRSKLVSLGEMTKVAGVATDKGMMEIPVTFELLCEFKNGGFTRRYWHRYRDRPNDLVAQFHNEPTDKVEPMELPSEVDVILHRAMAQPLREPPPADMSERLFSRPEW